MNDKPKEKELTPEEEARWRQMVRALGRMHWKDKEAREKKDEPPKR